MTSKGILCGGQLIADTKWAIRDEAAWWDPSDPADRFQMRPSATKTDLLIGHWTAGEAGAKTHLDDGPRVVRVMKRRKRRKNPDKRLRVSVQFVIGACEPDDEYAPVWQTMEIGTKFSAIHVGRGVVCSRSIGVEVVSCGVDGQTNVRDRETTQTFYRGKTREVCLFYPGQIRSWVRLANTLSGVCLPGAIEIPRTVPVNSTGQVKQNRFTRRGVRNWAGAMEHFHMPGTRKIDAANMLMYPLLEAGWESESA